MEILMGEFGWLNMLLIITLLVNFAGIWMNHQNAKQLEAQIKRINDRKVNR